MVKTSKFILLSFVLCISACGQKPEPENALQKMTLQQEWFPFSGYTGEVAAAERFDESNGLDIVINEGSEELDPIKLLISGQVDVAVVSSDLLITAASKGAELVAIGAINHISPTCFISKKELGINNPSDFEGKAIGVLAGTNTEIIYRRMLTVNNIQQQALNEVAVPFDLQTFVAGKYDVRPAFIYDEPVSLKLQGIEFDVLMPSDFGVSFLGTVYITTRETIEQEPEKIRRFVKTLVEGWSYAIANAEPAVEMLVNKYPSLSKARELASFELGIPYFQGFESKPLNADSSAWAYMISSMEEMKMIEPNSVKVSDIWYPDFIE